MKLKTGAIVTDLRGSAGGHTVQMTKDGLRMSPKAQRTNPQSAKQLNRRYWLKRIAFEWRMRTEAQRATWNRFAQNYPSYITAKEGFKPSGFDAYKLINLNRSIAGLTPVTVAPAFELPPPCPPFTVFADRSANVINVVFSQAIPPGYRIIYRASLPMSRGSSQGRNKLRIVAITMSNNTVSRNLNSDVTSAIAPWSINQKYLIEVSLMHNTSFLTSQPRRAFVIVVP